MFSLDHYTALAGAAGFVERSARGLIVVEGQDRASLLHNILTNDIATLAPGTGCYSAYLTPPGRMVSDMRVLNMGDALWLDVPGRVTTHLLQRLDQSIFAEDVRLSNRTDAFVLVGLFGPLAADVIARVLAEGATASSVASELAATDEYNHHALHAFDADFVVVRDNELGVPGFDLYVPASHREAIDRFLAVTGVPRVDLETADVLRVEAGRPEWGAELDEDVIPMEAGIESRAISFTKGCYIGQEVIVRILHRGHGRVARRLVGLLMEREGRVAPGDRVQAEGREIGAVTSAVVSPALERPIALAYVRRDFVAAGTRVDVIHVGETFSALVTTLPFVPR